MSNKKMLLVLLFFITSNLTFSQNITGIIEGEIIDKENKSPLVGATVLIENSSMGNAANIDGKFVIENVNVGSYSLKISYIGYESIIKTDVIVRSGRRTFIKAELQPSIYQTQDINVTAGYFSEVEKQPVNTVSFSYEEIRRAPGAAGDVSRIMMSLPSVAKVNDQTNNLIVRGGSPLENAFYVDNIEIPNINHFPTQGASGGPLGLINVDFINDVNFYSGGFSSAYGDKLSSIMDMSFREGNKNNIEGQLDLNFAGFGGVVEGPISDKGSYMLSVRRSYFDLLAKTINIGTTVAPSYGDYQWKVVYDIDNSNKLELIGIWGDDHNNQDQKTAIENDMIYYGNQDIFENTTGINWQQVWGKAGYSNTSLSFTSTKFDEDYFETGSALFLRKNNSKEQDIKFRNVNYIRLNNLLNVTFGVEAKFGNSKYDNLYGTYTDALGNNVPEEKHIITFSEDKYSAFVNFSFNPFKQLTTSIGSRADYFTFNKQTTYSPRVSINYQLDDLSSIKAFAGLFYQNLPAILLSQSSKNKELKDPLAIHYILGYERLLNKDTRLTIDLYYKNYKNLPLDPAQPSLFLIDEIYYRSGYFFNHSNLISEGKAFSKGIEIMVQKKLAEDFYGLVSFSYSTTEYKALDNVWRKRVYDNKIIASIEGGYKPNTKWEFSLRWVYAGGTPYTPFNLQKSQDLNRAVLDENLLNANRYPDYHSLNLRVDRRFNFSNTNLVVYLSVWNAYSRKNVATYFWNETEKKPNTIYQWTLIPIFGLEYEF